jgi:malate synthase
MTASPVSDERSTTGAGARDERVERAGLRVAAVLERFVADELLPGLALSPSAFWQGLADLFERFVPRNTELLARRRELQVLVDEWHEAHDARDVAAVHDFLDEIGYLEPEPEALAIDVAGVDPEIATLAGPQLVVPLNNARYALNAANARWGSLYDALYGTDAVPETAETSRAGAYNARRGAVVIARALEFLDRSFPLERGSYADAVEVTVSAEVPHALVVRTPEGTTGLLDPAQFTGFRIDGRRLTVVLRHHGLGVQLVVDPTDRIGAQQAAGLADVLIESAITTICDCEDSVAAVDADDKVEVYRNWLELMIGTLQAPVEKDGRTFTRALAPDLHFVAPDGGDLELSGRAVLLVRNVGLHIDTDAVLTADGRETPEGILDALVTIAAGVHDLQRGGAGANSRTGSIYVVKPKLHGSAEVTFTVELLAAVEQLLGLPEHTVKLGLMDEERRTSVNLAACIAASRQRLIFVNTGFLDRTGDELHTMRAAGPAVRKGAMRATEWFGAYEDRNVDCGLAAGFAGHAQIGKGMWASPDAMADMLATKVAHPRAGASCAWVPSPTAATLHALHYHEVDVAAVQRELAGRPMRDRAELLLVPLLPGPVSPDDVSDEIRNNAQGILGYVVRWVEHGVGCSKVPDIDGVNLMEDRATLRISSQQLANWLRWGIVDRDAVEQVLREMAEVVDAQNTGDPDYRPMAADLESSPGFNAARELVFTGVDAPNGYTEPVLHRWRRAVKQGRVRPPD